MTDADARRTEGTIRHAGLSNYPVERWRKAEQALGRPLLSNQVPFSLAAPKAAKNARGISAETRAPVKQKVGIETE